MKILLVGGGNMGTALLLGWRKHLSDLQVTAVDPHPSEALKALCHAPHKIATDVNQVKGDFDVVVIAIKPQSFGEVLPALQQFALPDTVFLSIAAGKSISGMQEFLGKYAAVIRAMPNTPALIGQGITVCVPNINVSDVQKQNAQNLLEAVGDVVWITDEEQMHTVTALSGSGPAYVFAMIEAMEKAGEACGLSAELSLQLARKTVQGAGALATHSEKSPAELRQQVTSPGGTTEAGLKILQDNDALQKLVTETISAATKRSRDLA